MPGKVASETLWVSEFRPVRPAGEKHNRPDYRSRKQQTTTSNGQRSGGGEAGVGGGASKAATESAAMKAIFYLLLFLAEVLLFGTITLLIYWIFNYQGGVAWANDPKKQFNLHYILMVGGFIFLNGHAMLVYRSFTCCKKIYNKLLHTIFFVLSISAITIGIVSAFQAHNASSADPKHFYSLHSWIGLGTMGLFALQFIVGFVSFLVLLCCDKATVTYRQRLVPIHTNFGLIIFSTAAAACVTGLMQTAKGRFNGKDGAPNYKDLPEEAIFVNTIAIAIIALTILLPLLVRNNLRGGQTVLSIN